MAGFDDLLAEGMPYLAVEEIEGTQGATWTWGYVLDDYAYNAVDVTGGGFTAACHIRSKPDGVDVVAVTVTRPIAGQVVCKVAPGLSDDVPDGVYFHELTLTRVSDGAVVVVVGGGDSRFGVKRGAL